MKANRIFLTLVASLMLATMAWAQESPSKQINQIKRNSSYLYAEATMESPKEALSAARELLMQQVKEYIGTKSKFMDTEDVLVKNINGKCESLSMMRGTMHRMFVYVKKSDIEAISNATAFNTTTNTTKVIVEQSMPPISAPEQSVDPVEESNDEQDFGSSSTTNSSQGEAVESSDLPAWQLQAINELMDCQDINAVKAKFNRLKAEYKLKKYGTPDKCTSVNDAFWVIFKQDGSVATVLGPGSSERVSYRDMHYSSLDNYKGQNALWFNFAK